MRWVFPLIMMLAAAGCLGGQASDSSKPDDAGMGALFSDALSHSTPLPPPSNESLISIPDTIGSTVTTTTPRPSATSTSTTHAPTTTVAKTIACSDIQSPMGQKDCDKGYCPSDAYTCRYYPGSFASGTAKCVCFRVTTTTIRH